MDFSSGILKIKGGHKDGFMCATSFGAPIRFIKTDKDPSEIDDDTLKKMYTLAGLITSFDSWFVYTPKDISHNQPQDDFGTEALCFDVKGPKWRYYDDQGLSVEEILISQGFMPCSKKYSDTAFSVELMVLWEALSKGGASMSPKHFLVSLATKNGVKFRWDEREEWEDKFESAFENVFKQIVPASKHERFEDLLKKYPTPSKEELLETFGADAMMGYIADESVPATVAGPKTKDEIKEDISRRIGEMLSVRRVT